jgi:FkbM family methyltransferase
MLSTHPFMRLGYSLYSHSFLHPHLGGLIKRSLRLRSRFTAHEPFVHDLGDFRMRLDLDQLIDTSIYYMGTWEEEEIAVIRKLLPAGGTAIDVGANIGFMTLHMASQVGPQGRVVAFEPTTWAVERLRENLALNAMPQVTVERLGLGDRDTVHVDVPVAYSYPLVGDRPVMRDSLVIRTLDGYLAEHPLDRLDLIKCDTDGCEVKVFAGAAETLRRFRPALVLEINPGGLAEYGDSVERLIELLHDCGYELFHQEDLRPFGDLDHSARHVAAHHDIDVVALPRAS